MRKKNYLLIFSKYKYKYMYIKKFFYIFNFFFFFFEILLIYYRKNEGAEKLGLNFTVDIKDCFGNLKTVELKPNGANINVTDSNKNEYIE